MNTWTKLEDGTWAIRTQDCDFLAGAMVGFPAVVTTKAGKKSRVVVGEHVKTFRVKGGRFVDIYKVDDEATATKPKEWRQA